MPTRVILITPAARLLSIIAPLVCLGLAPPSTDAMAYAVATDADSVANAGTASQDSLSRADSVSSRPNPEPEAKETSLRGMVGKVALAEGLIALNAGFAAGAPVPLGIVYLGMGTVVFVTDRDGSKRTEKLVSAFGLGAIGVYNIIMGAGTHSEDTILAGNMIAWNVLLAGVWMAHNAGKNENVTGSRGSGPWSVGPGMVGNAPGLRVAYRFGSGVGPPATAHARGDRR